MKKQLFKEKLLVMQALAGKLSKKQLFLVKMMAIAVITLLIEFFLSNNIGDLIHPAPKTALELSNFVCGSGAAYSEEDEELEFTQNTSVELTLDEPVESQNLMLKFDGSEDSYVTGEISITDESRVNEFKVINDFSCNPNGKYNGAEIPLHSNGKLLKLKITITDGISDPVYLQKVTLNRHKLHFQFVRWLVMAFLIGLIYCARYFRLSDVYYDIRDKKTNIATIIVWLLTMGIAFMLLQNVNNLQEPIEYPLEDDPTTYSIMVQQFDAFQKGQLELDYPTDVTYFEGKENLYDFSQRNSNESNLNYWDRVYYDGKFYSYFGVAPILVVYYPYYWMTKTLPTDAATSFFFSVLAITFCFMLIRRFISCFRVQASVIYVFLAFLALPAASYLFMLQSCADFYNIPYSAVNAFLLMFLYASLAAYENRATRRGIIWYVVAGLALGLSVASRPTTVVPIFLLILPLYLHVLRDKEITKIQKGKLVGGFSLPVCAIAAVLMWYNFARFGSPFDFGVTHQITVSDIHYNHLSLSLSRIADCLHQYWFQPLGFSETFPYINFLHTAPHMYGGYTYHGFGAIAVFAMPLNFSLLLLPVLVRARKPLYQKAMLIMGFVGGALILYVNYCLGGIHIRYACDASLLFTMLSLIALGFLINCLHKNNLKQFVYVGYLLVIVSILIGGMMMFANECCNIQKNAPDIFLAVKQFFTILG